MDVLWFRLPRRPTDGEGLDMRVGAGRVLLGIDRDDFWQIADVIPKGGFDAVRAAGLEAFRAAVAEQAPAYADRVDQIAGWDDVKVLSVRVDRLRRWYAPGVLLIGDAAHAMSPIGGVGINLAVQDAVAAARILADPIAGAGSAAGCWPRCSRAGGSRPSAPRPSRSSSSGHSWAGCWRATGRSPRLPRCGCSSGSRRCRPSRPG